jgi:TetR/AcrR family transcriptional regulator, regulator of cefoperazone and chloramphenicol sensitivity
MIDIFENMATFIPATIEQIDRRMSLLQSAFDVIAERGFEGLRTRAVAERAGVNVATLHYYFPSKTELIAQLAKFLGQKFATLHASAPPPTGYVAWDRLRQEFADVRYYQSECPGLTTVMLELNLRGQRDAEVKAVVDAMKPYWRRGLEAMVKSGVADGTFHKELNVGQATTTLMAILSGLSFCSLEEVNETERAVEQWLLAPGIQAKGKRK